MSITNRLELRHLTSLDNVLEIYKFISSSSRHKAPLKCVEPFIAALNNTNNPVDLYLKETSSPELTREAVIRKAKEDVGCVTVEGLWLESKEISDNSEKIEPILKAKLKISCSE